MNFGRIDGVCHRELLEYFGIDEVFLPTIVAYSPVKFRVSSNKLFTDMHNRRFLDLVAKRKARTFKRETPLEEVYVEENC